MKNERIGKGYKWSSSHDGPMGLREVSGFTVDNLDTKSLEQATSAYERAFIIIRESLEENESCCMDIETERLQCVQAAADALRASGLLRPDQ